MNLRPANSNKKRHELYGMQFCKIDVYSRYLVIIPELSFKPRNYTVIKIISIYFYSYLLLVLYITTIFIDVVLLEIRIK